MELSRANRVLLRRNMVANALEGEIQIMMRRGNGSVFTFTATLTEGARLCADTNAEEYYKSIGTTRNKVRRQRAKERAKIIERSLEWVEQLERDLNMFWVVDTVDFRWRMVSLKSLVAFRATGR